MLRGTNSSQSEHQITGEGEDSVRLERLERTMTITYRDDLDEWMCGEQHNG